MMVIRYCLLTWLLVQHEFLSLSRKFLHFILKSVIKNNSEMLLEQTRLSQFELFGTTVPFELFIKETPGAGT